MSISAEGRPSPLLRSLAEIAPLAELRHRQPVLTATGLLLVLAMLPLGFAALIDGRILIGVSVWEKPLKFAFALAVYTLTLAYFTGWIEAKARQGLWFRGVIAAACASIAFEQAYIVFQAARGVGSHFNVATAWEANAYSLMGIGAVMLTAAAPAVGWLILRRPAEWLSPILKDGAAIGLILTFPLTLIVAGTMAQGGGHWVGGASTDANGLFLMGWARDGGDLRVPHFFATHAMHAIPLAAFLSGLVFGQTRRWPIFAVSVVYVAFTLAVFAQALSGRPFLPALS